MKDTMMHCMWTTMAWLAANWTELGAGILMALQAAVLLRKLFHKEHKYYKRRRRYYR